MGQIESGLAAWTADGGSWLFVVLVVLVGFGSGVLSGMLGVGGAVVTTPGIRVLGASPLIAVGSTVPAILPGAVSGAWRYQRTRLVDWRIGLVCGATGSVLAYAGARLAGHVDGHVLMLITAALGIWSGVSVFRAGARVGAGVGAGAGAGAGAVSGAVSGAVGADAADGAAHLAVAEPGVVALALVGAVAGFVAGLLGVGGGAFMVPLFTGVLRVPMKRAVASSLVAVAIFSVPALLTHWYYQHIDWRYALLLAVGVVPGARLGARITVAASERLVRRGFGLFLVGLAGTYAVGELLALLRS